MSSGGMPVIVPVGPLWRIGRATDPYGFSRITPEIDVLDNAGNRFDVLGGGVLYAATQRGGAFIEVLQGFRPTTRTRLLAHRSQPDLMLAGSIPADWRDRRRLVQLTLPAPAPFVDIENPKGWPGIEDWLAAELADLAVANLDVSVVRSNRRSVTRLIARWAYLQSDPATGRPRYSGIRYLSKFGDHECWAIFEGTRLDATGQWAIDADDPDYLFACHELNLAGH